MKKIFAFALFLVLCLSFAGCSTQQTTGTDSIIDENTDLDLIVYRDVPEDDNQYNIERLTIKYSWVGGYVEQIQMQYDCATEEDAQAAYDSLLENYSDSIKIDEKRVTYNEDTSVWRYAKYDEVRNNYLSMYWSVIDDDKYIMAMSEEASENNSETASATSTDTATEAAETTEAAA